MATYITNGQKKFWYFFKSLSKIKNSCFELIKKAKNIGSLQSGNDYRKQEYLKELKGYRDIFPVEDIDLWNRMALSGHIIFAFTKKFLSKYRLHSNSVTTSKYWQTFFLTLYLKNNLNNLKKKKRFNIEKIISKKNLIKKVYYLKLIYIEKYIADYIFRLSAIYYLEKRKNIFFIISINNFSFKTNKVFK